MTIREMAERLDAVVYAEPEQLDEDLSGAFTHFVCDDAGKRCFAETRRAV